MSKNSAFLPHPNTIKWDNLRRWHREKNVRRKFNTTPSTLDIKWWQNRQSTCEHGPRTIHCRPGRTYRVAHLNGKWKRCTVIVVARATLSECRKLLLAYGFTVCVCVCVSLRNTMPQRSAINIARWAVCNVCVSARALACIILGHVKQERFFVRNTLFRNIGCV